MTGDKLLEYIAPCSLMCYTCSAYKKGAVCTLSQELAGYLEGVCEFKEKHTAPENGEALEHYRIFEEELKRLGAAECDGCRSGAHQVCSIRGCFIMDCVKEHSVDFCGECPLFPCEKVKEIFEEEVYRQWLEGNQRIRQSGAEAFWNQNKGKSHYLRYRKNTK